MILLAVLFTPLIIAFVMLLHPKKSEPRTIRED